MGMAEPWVQELTLRKEEQVEVRSEGMTRAGREQSRLRWRAGWGRDRW